MTPYYAMLNKPSLAAGRFSPEICNAVGSVVLAASSSAMASLLARYGPSIGPRLALASSCERIRHAIPFLPTASFRPSLRSPRGDSPRESRKIVSLRVGWVERSGNPDGPWSFEAGRRPVASELGKRRCASPEPTRSRTRTKPVSGGSAPPEEIRKRFTDRGVASACTIPPEHPCSPVPHRRRSNPPTAFSYHPPEHGFQTGRFSRFSGRR